MRRKETEGGRETETEMEVEVEMEVEGDEEKARARIRKETEGHRDYRAKVLQDYSQLITIHNLRLTCLWR